jgi:hypothetical protein
MVLIRYSVDLNAPTLTELQQGKAVGGVVPLFEAYLRSKQKATPELVEALNQKAQAS